MIKLKGKKGIWSLKVLTLFVLMGVPVMTVYANDPGLSHKTETAYFALG